MIDTTQKQRQARRRKGLDQKAGEEGFSSWSALATAVLNAEKVSVTIYQQPLENEESIPCPKCDAMMLLGNHIDPDLGRLCRCPNCDAIRFKRT